MSLPIDSTVTINRKEWTVKAFDGTAYVLTFDFEGHTKRSRLPRQYVEDAKEKGDPVEIQAAEKAKTKTAQV